MGVLYIFDEPTIGLHQRDNAQLIATLTRLRDLGNTVLVVEHDEEMIRAADWVIDIGPGRRRARRRGRRQRHARGGPRRAALDHRRLPARRTRDPGPDSAGARATASSSSSAARASTTSRDIDVRIPLGKFVARDRRLGLAARARSSPRSSTGRWRASSTARASRPGAHDRSTALEHVDKVDRDRPDPDRAHAALEPGDVHRAVHADPRAVRRRARRRACAATRPGRFSLQRQGRPLRELQGRRHHQDRDAVPAGRLRALRGLQGQALQPRGARDPLPRPDDRRRARDDGRGGARVLLRPCPTSARSCRR